MGRVRRPNGPSLSSATPPACHMDDLCAVAVFVWRIFFTYSVNLIPDECSYWAWSRRLDWSYFDNSGMVAYLIRLSTSLFNESAPFTVRFPFLILSGLTTFFIYRTGALLFESRSKGLTFGGGPKFDSCSSSRRLDSDT